MIIVYHYQIVNAAGKGCRLRIRRPEDKSDEVEDSAGQPQDATARSASGGVGPRRSSVERRRTARCGAKRIDGLGIATVYRTCALCSTKVGSFRSKCRVNRRATSAREKGTTITLCASVAIASSISPGASKTCANSRRRSFASKNTRSTLYGLCASCARVKRSRLYASTRRERSA